MQRTAAKRPDFRGRRRPIIAEEIRANFARVSFVDRVEIAVGE
jgi:hypothetical protein